MDRKIKAALTKDGGIWEEVLDSLPGSVSIVDHAGHILYMNSYGQNLYKVNKEDYIGRHCLDDSEQIMSPRMEGLVSELLETGKPHKTISRMELKDDQLFTTISIGVPLSKNEGYVLVGIPSKEVSADKKELKRLTSKIEKYGKFLESLIDSSPNAIFAMTRSGEVELSNKKAEAMFGYDTASMLGMDVSQFFKDSSEVSACKNESMTERSVETNCVTKEGKSFPVRLQVSDIEDAEGAIQGKLYIFTDISHEKAMEAKLALSEKLAIYSEMMAGIFHQINNPLVGVVNFSSVLLEKMEATDANRSLVSTIYDAGRKCQKLITTMMRCIREPESTFGQVQVVGVLESAVLEAMKEESERAEQVTLKADYGDNLLSVRGDALQLHQVFRNLVVNALQAMPEGGLLEVKIVLDSKGQNIEVQIVDSGEGISETDLDRIFTPFFSTKQYTGGGLGLSFAFQVIKSHFGRIDVESAVGIGTTFKVILPLAIEENMHE
jgi:PAS domain S-box-containing protein